MSPPRRKPDWRFEADSPVKIWVYHNEADVSVIWDRIGRTRGRAIHKPGWLCYSPDSRPHPGAVEFPAGTYFAPCRKQPGVWEAWTPRPDNNVSAAGAAKEG
jgi:hypothetical protein